MSRIPRISDNSYIKNDIYIYIHIFAAPRLSPLRSCSPRRASKTLRLGSVRRAVKGVAPQRRFSGDSDDGVRGALGDAGSTARRLDAVESCLRISEVFGPRVESQGGFAEEGPWQ